MYKYIGAILFGLFLSLPLHAAWTEANCNADKGGEIVTVNGVSFCRSVKATPNWWIAWAWCNAIGGHMPTIQELCPNQAIVQGAACGISYNKDIWSSTFGSKTATWHVETNNQMWLDWDLVKANRLYSYCLK